MIAKRRYKIRKATKLPILVGKGSIFGADRPVDGNRWVVPRKTVVAFVEQYYSVSQRAVCNGNVTSLRVFEAVSINWCMKTAVFWGLDARLMR